MKRKTFLIKEKKCMTYQEMRFVFVIVAGLCRFLSHGFGKDHALLK